MVRRTRSINKEKQMKIKKGLYIEKQEMLQKNYISIQK